LPAHTEFETCGNPGPSLAAFPSLGSGEGATAGWGPEVPWRISEF
jgi:hypothetical protein